MKRLVAMLLVASCCATPTAQPPVSAPTDTPNCGAACDHLRQLGCPEGQALEDGTTCTQFCEDSQTNGHALRPSCVQTIKTCAELNSKCGG
jgi:hypothetical protein